MQLFYLTLKNLPGQEDLPGLAEAWDLGHPLQMQGLENSLRDLEMTLVLLSRK